MKNDIISAGRKLLNIVRYALGGIFAFFAIFCCLAMFFGESSDDVVVLAVFAVAFLISAVALLKPRKIQNTSSPVANELNKAEQSTACELPTQNVETTAEKPEPEISR